MRTFMFAAGGLILGAVVGAVGGFLLGVLIADVTQMSCFEGACGFFALMIGILGFFIGLVGGLLGGLWLGRRTAKPA
jgi:hypothetical protein